MKFGVLTRSSPASATKVHRDAAPPRHTYCCDDGSSCTKRAFEPRWYVWNVVPALLYPRKQLSLLESLHCFQQVGCAAVTNEAFMAVWWISPKCPLRGWLLIGPLSDTLQSRCAMIEATAVSSRVYFSKHTSGLAAAALTLVTSRESRPSSPGEYRDYTRLHPSWLFLHLSEQCAHDYILKQQVYTEMTSASSHSPTWSWWKVNQSFQLVSSVPPPNTAGQFRHTQPKTMMCE